MPPVAVLLHGAGSSPGTARLLLGPALPAGAEVVAPDLRGTTEDAVRCIQLATAGRDVALVAGLSLGAHAAALWSARGGRTARLVLAMPAWTGAPGAVAALTARTAEEVEQRGSTAVLADIEADARGDWVLEELRRGWATYDDAGLVRALRAAATSPGPTLAELASVTAPTTVVALRDDPLHPELVAREWAAAIPGARYADVPRQAPATDRGALGRAAISGSR